MVDIPVPLLELDVYRHSSEEEESVVHSVVGEVGSAHFSKQVLSSPGEAISLPAFLILNNYNIPVHNGALVADPELFNHGYRCGRLSFRIPGH
jgi:hypothetical protein